MRQINVYMISPFEIIYIYIYNILLCDYIQITLQEILPLKGWGTFKLSYALIINPENWQIIFSKYLFFKKKHNRITGIFIMISPFTVENYNNCISLLDNSPSHLCKME